MSRGGGVGGGGGGSFFKCLSQRIIEGSGREQHASLSRGSDKIEAGPEGI